MSGNFYIFFDRHLKMDKYITEFSAENFAGIFSTVTARNNVQNWCVSQNECVFAMCAGCWGQPQGRPSEITCSFCIQRSGFKRLIKQASASLRSCVVRCLLAMVNVAWRKSISSLWCLLNARCLQMAVFGKPDRFLSSHAGTCSLTRFSSLRSVRPMYLHPQVHSKL